MSIVQTGQHRTCLANQAQRRRRAAVEAEAEARRVAAFQATQSTTSQTSTTIAGAQQSAPSSHTQSGNVWEHDTANQEEDALVDRIRAVLADITKHTRSVIAVSELKVASAITAHDWLERYIHRLDSDLERHEAALSLGLRPGTLPSKDAQVAQMQALEDAVLQNGRQPGSTATGSKADINASIAAHQLANSKTKAKAGPKGRKEKTPAEKSRWIYIPPDAPAWRETVNIRVHAYTHRQALLTFFSQNRYCYCHQPSYGSMVACDNLACEKEWVSRMKITRSP